MLSHWGAAYNISRNLVPFASLINPIAPAEGSPVPPVLSFRETCEFDLGKGEKGVINLGWTKRAATLPQGLL